VMVNHFCKAFKYNFHNILVLFMLFMALIDGYLVMRHSRPFE